MLILSSCRKLAIVGGCKLVLTFLTLKSGGRVPKPKREARACTELTYDIRSLRMGDVGQTVAGNKNIIQTTGGTVASIGLEQAGKKVAGSLVAPQRGW